jgi:hypothetical protein
MDRSFDEVLNDVLSLGRQEQALIAERIVGGLVESPEEKIEHEAAWRAEVRHRMQEIDTGNVKMREMSDVISEARARIRK